MACIAFFSAQFNFTKFKGKYPLKMKTIISNHINSNRDTISEREIQKREKKIYTKNFGWNTLTLDWIKITWASYKDYLKKNTTENEQFK